MLLNTALVFGQPGGGGDPGHGQPVPISGIELLIAAGVGLGAKKLLKKYKTPYQNK